MASSRAKTWNWKQAAWRRHAGVPKTEAPNRQEDAELVNMSDHTCKVCGAPATVTRNQERYTLPAWHVECTKCGPRDEATVDVPVANGIAYA